MFETTFYDDIPMALFVDLVVVCLCSIALLRHGRLSHSHPAITYLVFHILVVPSRLIAISAGAETLFPWGGFEVVTEVEIVRAASLFDLTLIVMTIAWIRASVIDGRKQRAELFEDSKPAVTLSLPHIWGVVLFALPIGILGLLLFGNIPGFQKPEVDLGVWEQSSWVFITITWAGLALLALIYWYGFRWWLLTPMTLYLLLMAVQGFHRFRFIIPLILLGQIYLDRRGKKWPTPMVLTVMIGTLMLFFPLKQIGRMTQSGETFSEIQTVSTESISEAMGGQHSDQEILDQCASALTLIDRGGKFYYGEPYTALVTSPMPRQWWPEKPGLADYLQEISTPQRPMFEMGMIVSFVGDCYLNFGYVGIVLLSYLFAYSLARVYFRAYRTNYFSVLRFAYLLIACNLIQIYRDGLMSIFIFTCVNMMPLVVIVLLHYVKPLRHKVDDYALTYHKAFKTTN